MSLSVGAIALQACSLVLCSAALLQGQESAPQLEVAGSEEAAPTEWPAWEPRYHGLAEIEALLGTWASLRPEFASRIQLAGSADVPCLQLAWESERPVAERPTLLLIGGLDGISLAGAEAVLSILSAFAAEPSLLPQDVVLIGLPWASPEGLARTLAGEASGGRTHRPLDEDCDGLVDEDAPEDLDADGLILNMLVEDPRGPWTRARDARFLVPAREGDSPRYVLTLEGRDADVDGLFNEDGPGGILLEENFPRLATSAQPFIRPDRSGGALPFSEPLARAIADLALDRATAAVILFQGDHGELVAPCAIRAALHSDEHALCEDLPSFEFLGHLLAQARASPERTVRLHPGASRSSPALDWFYEALGVLCVELAPFGPGVAEASAEEPLAALGVAGDEAGGGLSSTVRENGAWTRWLDDGHGGLGYRGWYPVELGGGMRGLLGGWEPFTRVNPPPEELPAAMASLLSFVRALSEALPRLDVRMEELERRGDLVTMRLRVRNNGALPTGLWPSGRWRRRGEPCALSVSFGGPSGAEVLAGQNHWCLPRLLAGASSEEIEWVGLLPEGETLPLVVRAPWAAPHLLELTP